MARRAAAAGTARCGLGRGRLHRRLACGGRDGGVSGPSAYWYLTRGTGVVALLLLTIGLVLGVMGPTAFRTSRLPRFAVSALHRNVTLLALAFVVVHVVTTILDGYTP